MKRMKNNYSTLTLIAFFSLFAGFSTIQAQEKPFLQFGGKDTVKKEGAAVKKASCWTKITTTPWIVQFGPDVVLDGDQGVKKNFLKIISNKNYYPVHCSAEKYLFKGISIQGVFSSETMNKENYHCIDINAKYNLK